MGRSVHCTMYKQGFKLFWFIFEVLGLGSTKRKVLKLSKFKFNFKHCFSYTMPKFEIGLNSSNFGPEDGLGSLSDLYPITIINQLGIVDILFKCGTMNVSACIRALPPQFTISASSSKSASVSGDKSEDEAYQANNNVFTT